MTAVTAKDYFDSHKDQQQEYLPVETAYPVRAGDTIVISMGILFESTATQDGYTLSPSHTFLSAADFAAKTTPADTWELPIPREDLSAEDLARITPVKKGERAVIGEGLKFETTIDHDGFLIETVNGGKYYLSNLALTSEFNYAGKKYDTEKAQVVVRNDAAPLRGIILAEDVTFDFKAGPYDAKAGELLYINPDDEDGYTVASTDPSPNATLRVTAAATADKQAKSLTAEKQRRLKNATQRFKLR